MEKILSLENFSINKLTLKQILIKIKSLKQYINTKIFFFLNFKTKNLKILIY